MRGFWLAWGFLSRLPVPEVIDVQPADLARATRWYPLVGLAVGGVQIAALTLGSWAVNPLFGAVLAVAAGEWFTRGFHLDGFADCLDGLLVNGDAARRLAVMKDPHVGGLGAAGVALWVLLRVASILALVESGLVIPAMLAGPVLARGVLATDILTFPSASPTGLYATLRGSVTRWDAVVACFLAVPASAVICALSPVRGGLAVGGVVLLPFFWHRGWVKKIGGLNGDVVGAGVQIRELWVWACLG
jgi:adenosylcobinamide-GDP ribazoletransferase